MKTTKSDKKRQASQKRKIRASQVVVGTLEGKTQGEIAEELSLTRQTVNEIFNSKEAAAILKRAENRLIGMVDDALDAFQDVVRDREDNSNRLKAAQSILKSKGIVKDNAEVTIHMPKPTVIRSPSGEEIRLGYKEEDSGEE
jgi:predicted transcriptional regulator